MKVKGQTYHILRRQCFLRLPIIALLETIAVLARGVVFSYLSKQIVETLLGGEAYSLILPALLLLLDLCLATVAQAVSKYERARVSCQATKAMEDAALDQYARMEKRREYTAETMLGYISATAPQASGETLMYALNVAQTGLSILTTAAYAWILSPWLLAVILTITLMILLIMQKNTQKLPELYDLFFEHERVLDAKLWEQVKNHEVASFLNLDLVKKGYENRNAAFLRDLVKIKRISNKVQFVHKYGPLFLMVLTVFCGGFLNRFGQIRISEIYAILVMIPTLAGSLLALPSMLTERKKYAAAHRLLNDFFDSAQETPAGDRLNGRIQSLEMRRVCFTYPNAREPALRDVTLSLGSGLNCLAGPSGGGKSTILLLLLRVLHAQSGQVCLNKRDIRSYDRENLYAHIGYAGQKPVLFQGTLRENIAQNQPFDGQRFWRTLEKVRLAGWASGLAEKENAAIDVDKLSSGEKQKIALARALYRDADLLILDEATSQMDPAAEQAVLQALKEYAREKERIVVYTAHREVLIQAADRLFRVEDGAIVREENRAQNAEGRGEA